MRLNRLMNTHQPGTLPGYMLNADDALELSPDYDYQKLQQLERTLNILREVGLI